MLTQLHLCKIFQSTRSARSATRNNLGVLGRKNISIHALRKERDVAEFIYRVLEPDFNPRAPQGARPAYQTSFCHVSSFQSTRSARSATTYQVEVARKVLISIHALRKERDMRNTSYSNSRIISIHALRKERDPVILNIYAPKGTFQSTRSARSATCGGRTGGVQDTISIHALRKERDRWATCRRRPHRISIHALRKERDSMPACVQPPA